MQSVVMSTILAPYMTLFMILLIFIRTLKIYCRAGNFREVYISRSSRLDQIRESLSREFVNITIQTHNTSTQIVKLKLRKCLFEHEITKFYSANILRSTVCL